MASVQTTLDASHPAKSDVVAAIKTPSCGMRFFTSGPSKYDATILHRVASVSKTYTGAIVLSLVEEGLVSLDDPASKWLTDVPGGDAIHVRHLLRHQSGLVTAAPSSSANKTTPEAILTNSFKIKTKFSPGAQFDYQNVNFTALGMIAQKVTGKTLPTLIHERIDAKLGLTSTFFEGGETIAGTIAKTHTTLDTPGTYAIDASQVWGAGSMVATPTDVATWMEQFGSGTFFQASTVDAMHETVPWVQGTLSYGLAMMELDPTQTFSGGVARGHFGDLTWGDLFNGNSGYHTGAFYFPDEKTTVVVMQDYEAAKPENTRDPFIAVVKALFPAEP